MTNELRLQRTSCFAPWSATPTTSSLMQAFVSRMCLRRHRNSLWTEVAWSWMTAFSAPILLHHPIPP
ncbi:hypothetical protein BCR44DRAFT_1435666 [Catenaria anguillulae PL171]|uniref:Uncharacterized protein n=1 Tax=Catenaria anguillulae PL171 TaxID=765915 RepID=A0A1Y2HJE6_9FUNG|nr:hypothetical protein BCR44DRAFT_1435666 [Catenaria anguillulae PL171]